MNHEEIMSYEQFKLLSNDGKARVFKDLCARFKLGSIAKIWGVHPNTVYQLNFRLKHYIIEDPEPEEKAEPVEPEPSPLIFTITVVYNNGTSKQLLYVYALNKQQAITNELNKMSEEELERVFSISIYECGGA